MQAQAQFTIHSLNDVIASTTAPESPYKGQLWVNTSYSPPRTFVYNGSAWKEQNGTDTLRSNITTLTTKSNTMRSDLDGLTSTVSSVTTRVETVENDLGVVEENILDIESSVSELEQTASSIALRVTKNETNISSLTVAHDSLEARVETNEGNITTLKADVSGIKTRVSTAEGDISTLEQTATSLTTRVSSAEGNITTLTTSVNGLKTRVSTAEGDISAIEQDVSSITTRVTTAEGDISSLETSISGIRSRVSTAEGKITTLTQTVDSLALDVEDNRGNIASLTLTVDGLSSDVADNRGNISSLSQTVSTLSSKVSTNTGNISTLTQSVDAVKVQVETNRGNISTLTTSVSGIATRVTNAENDISTIEQNVTSITSRVSTAEGNISTVTQKVSSLTTRVSTAEGDITTLEQTTTALSATVETKADEEGGDTTSFGWKLTSSGFYLYSSGTTVMSVTSSGLSVTGSITASSGTIGGFTIGSSSIYKTKTSYSSSTSGVYIGTDGIGLGAGKFYVTSAGALTSTSGKIGGFTISSSAIYKTKTSYSSTTEGVYLGTTGIGLGAGTFYVTSAGYLYASNASITGSITATSGTLSELYIEGNLYFGSTGSYYINPNYDNSSWYIYLPKFRVDDTSAYFSGTLQAPSGTIGGFTISTNSIYKTKTAYNNTTAGVYIGTDGIGLGAGKFYVTSAGVLYATGATISGTINATSGTFDFCTIGESCTMYGYLYCTGSEEVKFYGSKQDVTYETYMGGYGIASEVAATLSGTTYYSYSYVRPLGMILVPNAYATYANDGMIFGVMQAYTYRTENILAGCSFYYGNDGTNLASECIFRCCDTTWLDAIYTSSYGGEIGWGNINFVNYMYGKWYVGASSQYIYTTTVSSTTYACLFGVWYCNSSLNFGTSTTSYQIRIDSDQVTFKYNSTQIGEIETYSSYVDIQGTFKTNSSSWISSSDAKVKYNISDYTDAYSVLFDNLRPRTYKWKKGTSDRVHSGFVVQEVVDAISTAGLTTQDFAAVVAFGDPDDATTEWGLRYEEIISLNTWEIQKLKARIAELENKINQMEEKQ